jgi:hypothetical protein
LSEHYLIPREHGWLVLACGAEVLPVEVDCVLVAGCAV